MALTRGNKKVAIAMYARGDKNRAYMENAANAAARILPEIDVIKQCMKDYGAEGALMTGSGSAIFGIFEEKSDADDCMNELERHFENVWLTEPVSECQVIK